MTQEDKIYFNIHSALYHHERHNEDDIVYIRTDDFIDKACKWLEDNLYDYAGEDDKRNIVPFDKSIFEDFRKAMKE